jgi:cytochrome P450
VTDTLQATQYKHLPVGVPALTDYHSIVEALADPACFPQWDGAVRTSQGVVNISLLDENSEQDWELVPSSAALIPEMGEGPYSFAQTPLFLNPPEHTRFRGLLNDAWGGAKTAADMASAVADDARRLLSSAAGQDEFEFMRAVALPLSSMTLAAFFGEDDPTLWVDRSVQQAELMWGKRDDLQRGARFQEQVWNIVQARRHSPRDDLISRMLTASRPDLANLRLNEIATFAVQAPFPNTNVARLLGSVAHRLSVEPELRQHLRLHPSSIPGFVSEVLRTSPPLVGVFRHTARACSAGGNDLPAGHGLFLSFAQAHRDASRFPDPDEFRIDRGGISGQLAFGAGIHRCPAARLSLMQANVMAQVLCNLPELRMTGGGVSNYTYGLFTGPSELHLNIGA